MNTVSPEFISALRDATVIAPQLPNEVAFETCERLQNHEAQLVAPDKKWQAVRLVDYEKGSAQEPDAIWLKEVASAPTVASADHATNPYKRSESGYIRADHGTGAIAMLLAEDGLATSIAPRGRQTWNVAVSDDSHPVKHAIRQFLPSRNGFLSIHGMYSGKLRYLSDSSEVHAVIGLGAKPNELSWEAARKVVQAGKDMGLRLSIANQEALNIYDPSTGGLRINSETREPAVTSLRGSKPAMTNAFAYQIMDETGSQKASMQIELAAMLRLCPMDDEAGWHRNEKARAAGVYLGYLLTQAATAAVGGDH
jgi:hypothetical protein